MAAQTIMMKSTSPGTPKAGGSTAPGALLKPLGAAQAVVRNLRMPRSFPKLFGNDQEAEFVPPDVPRDRTDKDMTQGPFRRPTKNKKGSDFTSPFGSALEQASWSTSREQEQEQQRSPKSVFAKFWQR